MVRRYLRVYEELMPVRTREVFPAATLPPARVVNGHAPDGYAANGRATDGIADSVTSRLIRIDTSSATPSPGSA